MKKRLLSGVLAFVLLFGSAAALPEGVFETSSVITASAETWKDFEYSFSTDSMGRKIITITAYNGKEKKVTVPEKIDGGYVKYIKENVFQGNTKIESVTINAEMYYLTQNAFKDCTALKNVVLPDSINYAYYSVFEGCTSLESIKIPSGLTSIPSSFFKGCTKLSKIEMSDKITTFSVYAFEGTKWLADRQKEDPLVVYNNILIDGTTYKKSKLTIPSNIKKICGHAFDGNQSLKSVIVPQTVEDLGSNAFQHCDNLEKAVINSPDTELHGIFEYCGKLTDVTLCEGVEVLQNFMFAWCNSLKKIKLPSTVKVVGFSCFEGCHALEDVDIPYGVEEIGYYCFYNCDNLKKLWLPDTVKKIGTQAFYRCYADPMIVPAGVETINEKAFGYMGSGFDPDYTITGYKGSLAEKYAKENGLKFKAIKECPHSAVRKGKAEPTCTEDGYDGTLCKICNKLVSGKVKKATGHKFSSWKTVSFDVSKSTSTRTRQCSVCDTVESDTVENAVVRLAGDNRFGTAAAISKASYPKGAKTVILAFGLNYADALAGVPLAEKLNAPILLTHTKKIPDETLAEIKRLGAKKVILLGGGGAISEDVEKTLKKNGLKTKRIAGQSRFGTATAIANELNKAPEELFFVYGLDSADALSVGGAAAVKGAPIIYLTTDGKLNADTEAYLKTVKGKVKNAYVIGGDGVISDAMMKNVASALGLTVNKTLVRVAGKNRYETCVAVNKKFKNVVSSDGICVAKGLDFPDALAGGVYAAKNKQALFLADGNKLQDVQSSYLKSKNAAKITALGGTGAVPDDLVKLIAEASV